VSSTSPVNNTATSLSSTATLYYNRPFYENTGTHNFYLYRNEVSTSTDTLIATIPFTNNRITFNGTIQPATLVYAVTPQMGPNKLGVQLNSYTEILDDNATQYYFTIEGSTSTYQVTNITGIPGGGQWTHYLEFTPAYSNYQGNNQYYFNINFFKKDPHISIDLSDLIVPESTYYIKADAGMVIDMFALPSVAITNNTVFKYTPGPATQISRLVPPYGQTNQFVNSATIVYNRPLSSPSGNYYLNFESSGTVKTIAASSLSVSTSGTSSTINLTFGEQVLPEGEYFITNDQGTFKDNYNFPLLATTNNTKIKWYNTIMSDMGARRYRGDSPYGVFTATTPQVLDLAPTDPEGNYTFTLSSPIGEFSSPNGGTDAGSYWTFTGTKTQINALISSIVFTSYSPSNPPSTYTYSLSKGGVTLVNKTRDLYGILLVLGALGPTGKAFPRLNLTLAGTNSTNEPLTLTANISTSTILSGNIVFKSNNTEIAVVTISTSGAATTTTTFSTTGTRFISASWTAGTLPDGFEYEPLDSYDHYIDVDTAADFSGTVALSVVGRPSRRIPVGPPVNLLAQLTQNSTDGGTVTFRDIVPQTTASTYTTATTLTITGSGERYIDVVDVKSVAVNEWLEISGTMTTVGHISSNYRVSAVNGNRITFNARSEDDNIYYWYDPLKESVTPGITVTFDPVPYIATVAKTGYNRLSSTDIATTSVTNNSTTYTISFSSTGTKYIVADWSGTSTFPKYHPKSSELVDFQITERADYNGSLVLNLGTSTVEQFQSSNNVVKLSTPESTTGTITLRLISKLGSGSTVTTATSTPVVSTSAVSNQSAILVNRVIYNGNIYEANTTTVSTVRSTSTSVVSTSQTLSSFSANGYVVKNTQSTATTVVTVTSATTNATVNRLIAFGAGTNGGAGTVEILQIFSKGRYSTYPTVYVKGLNPNTNFVIVNGGMGHFFGYLTTPAPTYSGGFAYFYCYYVQFDTYTGEAIYPQNPATFSTLGVYTGSSAYKKYQTVSTATTRLVTTSSVIKTVTTIDEFVQQTDFVNTFTNGEITVNLPAGTFNTTATTLGVNSLQAFWNGQAYTPSVYYPYYAIESTTATQYVRPVQLTLSGRSSVSSGYANTFTVSLNTTTALAGTVSLYNGDVKVATTASNNNSATIILSADKLSLGNNYLRAVWDATEPASFSNTLTTLEVLYDIIPVSLTLSTSTYQLYNNSNNTSTTTASIIVRVGNTITSPIFIMTFPAGDSRILSQDFGIGSTSARLYIDRNNTVVGQSISINGQTGYTITTVSGTTPEITVGFTPPYNGSLGEYSPLGYGNYPSGIVSLIDSELGVISTGTLTSSDPVFSLATLNWLPASVGQTIGTRNLTVSYQGDYWYNTSTQTTSIDISRRISPVISLATTSSYYYTVGSTTTFKATKPDGVAFIDQVSFFNTVTNTSLGQASFVGNTATINLTSLISGTYSIQAVYLGDAYATVSSSTVATVNMSKGTVSNFDMFFGLPGSTFGTGSVSKAASSTADLGFGFNIPNEMLAAGVPSPTGIVRFHLYIVNNNFNVPWQSSPIIGTVAIPSTPTSVGSYWSFFSARTSYSIASYTAGTRIGVVAEYLGSNGWNSVANLDYLNIVA
jgi:hypothetical protein